MILDPNSLAEEITRGAKETAALVAKLDRAAAAERDALAAEVERLRAERDEARRRRDEWRAKAEEIEVLRKALREKVGAPWPPNLSRALWAGLAADEKRRADDAEAENAALREEVERLRAALERIAVTAHRGRDWMQAHARAALAERPEGQEVGE